MSVQDLPINRFADGDALAGALADRVADCLAAAMDKRDRAILAVSGGSTPGRFFDRLAQAELDWQRILVTLVDERYVPHASERSNTGLVRRRLLVGPAAAAQFMPLHENVDLAPDQAARQADTKIAAICPLDACILGMGPDGHTASWFPGGDNLARALDPRGEQTVLAMQAPGAGEPRLTLTLPVVLSAPFLALHIEGRQKRQALDRAAGEASPLQMPIRAVLDHAGPGFRIFWSD